MKTKNLLKYIIIGIVCAGLFLLAFAFIETLLHPEKTLADGFKSIFDYILAIVFGVSVASAVWKKDNQGENSEYPIVFRPAPPWRGFHYFVYCVSSPFIVI